MVRERVATPGIRPYLQLAGNGAESAALCQKDDDLFRK